MAYSLVRQAHALVSVPSRENRDSSQLGRAHPHRTIHSDSTQPHIMAATTARSKPYFNEIEAARHLGISIDEFRVLVRRHIVDREEDLNNMPITTFHASDLLLLRLLAGRGAANSAR